jgi:hypothetical protein
MLLISHVPLRHSRIINMNWGPRTPESAPHTHTELVFCTCVAPLDILNIRDRVQIRTQKKNAAGNWQMTLVNGGEAQSLTFI